MEKELKVSAHKRVFIYCDSDKDCIYQHEEAMQGKNRHASVEAYRAELKKFGWTCRGGKDYCTECSEIRTAHSAPAVNESP